MQRQGQTPTDGEQQREPEWELASYGQRVGAWALDFVGLVLPFILLIATGLAWATGFLLIGFKLSGPVSAAVFIVMIGYAVWWLFALGRGQTPGKQIVGIRVIKDDGEPSGWGYMFLREFVIKFVLVGALSSPTSGAAWIVDSLWPLWDKEKKMQTLHDKLLGTLVVRNTKE